MDITQALFWLTLTIYHEARGESVAGQKAVAKVILNRAKKNGWPVSNVVLSRKQFSCFNLGLDHPSVWIRNVVTAAKVLENAEAGLKEWQAGDTLYGATHYYALLGMPNHQPPYWVKGMKFIVEIKGHRFYKEG